MSAESSLLRFGVATVALAITVAAGYLSFRALTRPRPVVATAEGEPVDDGGALGVRLTKVEDQLAALRRALD